MRTQEQIKTEVLNYLTKTSNHLFVTENNEFFKVIPYEVNGRWYYLKLTFGKNGVYVAYNEVASEYMLKLYGNNLQNVIKSSLFPQHSKKTSIPYFKAMREAIGKVEAELKTVTGTTADHKGLVDTKIKEILKDLVVLETIK